MEILVPFALLIEHYLSHFYSQVPFVFTTVELLVFITGFKYIDYGLDVAKYSWFTLEMQDGVYVAIALEGTYFLRRMRALNLKVLSVLGKRRTQENNLNTGRIRTRTYCEAEQAINDSTPAFGNA